MVEHGDDFIVRVLSDTGACCRELLGWNYDEYEDPSTGKKIRKNVGTGGVRDHGPHQQMTAFVDDPKSHHKVLLAPRESYKSTVLQGFVIRQILRNPDVRILYGMRTADQIAKKSKAIQNALESPLVKELFGEQRGDLWRKTTFTVAGRKQTNLQEPTFSTFTAKSPPVGGHFDYIIFDDPVDERDYMTEAGGERAEEVIRACDPLQTVGGYMILVGTRYDDLDVYATRIVDEEWTSLVLDSNVTILRTSKGHELTGKPRFEHQTLSYLQGKLNRMKYQKFMSQYMNVVPRGLHQSFTRDHFKELAWQPDMERLSGFLLTDTAVLDEDKACYTVLAYVLLDARNVAYLADLDVGRWSPTETRDRFFKILLKWMAKVNHCGESFEEVSLNMVFMSMIQETARDKKVRLNIHKLKRGARNRKKERIQRLEGRFSDGNFFVVDTVPREFQDIGGTKLLWDPQGYTDPKSHERIPGGELVEQFVRFPSASAYCDIPDAIADIDAIDQETGGRVFYYRQARFYQPEQSLAEQRYQARIAEEYSHARSESGSWWDSIVGP